MDDYIPTTEAIRDFWSMAVALEREELLTIKQTREESFDRWLEQLKQEVRQDEREKVARWIEDSTIDFNTYNAYEVRNICAFIARGDSK